MDTSDPNISFDDNGQCDYCSNFDKNILPNWNANNSGLSKLLEMSESIKKTVREVILIVLLAYQEV